MELKAFELQKVRINTDATGRLRVLDNGVALAWDTVAVKAVRLYSEAQKALAGRATYSVDTEDPTVLNFTYHAGQQLYLGVYRVVVTVEYRGTVATYDAPVFELVSTTDEAGGSSAADLTVEVSAVDVSVLEGAIRAAAEAALQALDAKQQVLAGEAERVAAEAARRSAEIARQAAEQSREEAEEARKAAELARVSAEEGREAAEADRGSAEAARKAAELQRAADEAARKAAELERIAGENSRKAAELERAAEDLAVRKAEAAREQAEKSRKASETAREANEQDRQDFEDGRQQAETQRQEKEAQRQAQEATRQAQEAQRVETFNANEATRQQEFQTGEQQRQEAAQEAEAQRDQVFNSKEATRDAANAAALNAAQKLTELESHIGDLRDLETKANHNLVEAINEVFNYAYEPDGHVYGVRHYYNNASPILTRFQNATSHDLHQLLPVQSLMRRCVLKDDGEVAYYLDHDNSELKEDGTPANLDGTDGMVMVEIPAHYRKHTLVENAETPSLSYYETAISLLPFSGAFHVNKCYISAFEATVDRTTNTLASVANKSERFRGGNNNTAWDGTYRSLCGMPATAISLTNFRNYARKRGSLWNCQEWDIYVTLYWLYVVEYANLNSQLAFNEARDGSGYHQGGLGSGVTNIVSTPWSNYNNYYPFIPCGITAKLGNYTGIVPFAFDEEQAEHYGSAFSTNVPSYRGVENPFGHIYKWTDGFLAKGNGTKQMYSICHDRTQYASALNEAYEEVGLSVGANGYVKEIVRNEKGDILATMEGGGSTTYFSDYHYESFNNGTIYGVSSGGSAILSSYAGLAYLYSNNAPSATDANIGSRLCWSLHDHLYE